VHLTPAPWSPLAAAKQQLQTTQPDVFERINRTVANFKVARVMKKEKMESLGK